jgi:hypothetical protein
LRLISAYKGQNLKKPVANGTIPIQAHVPTCWVKAKVTKTAPTAILIPRSAHPILHFILALLNCFEQNKKSFTPILSLVLLR